MQLGHHPSQQQGHPSQQQGQITSPVSSLTPQPLIKKMLRVGKEDRTHDPEQGNQEPHHYATRWFVHISKFFIN